MKEIRYSFDPDDSIKKTIKHNLSDAYDSYENSNADINGDFNDDTDNKIDNEIDNEIDDKIDDNFEEMNVNENSYDGSRGKNSAVYNIDETIEDFDEPAAIKRKVNKPKKREKNIKRLKLKKIIAVLVIALGTGLCVAASPIFAVDEIVINDLHYFTKDEICSQIGLFSGTNGIFYNKLKAENTLEASPYISTVKISFKLPDTMIVSVSENRICGYIEYLGSYLYVDRSGQVIDIKDKTEESLPIIEGLIFSSFSINNEIPVKNKDAFQAALAVSNAMCKYEVLDDAVSINVSDTQNLYAYIDNVKVLLGDNSRLDEKIKTMAEAVKEIPDGDRGTLDLKDISKPIIFKYTT